MKTQELKVSCIYAEDGESIRNLIHLSFATFVKRELEKFASIPGCYV